MWTSQTKELVPSAATRKRKLKIHLMAWLPASSFSCGLPFERASASLTRTVVYFPQRTEAFAFIMKIKAAVLCLLASGVDAFSPQGFVPSKSGLMVPPSTSDDSNSPLWRPPMNMVAGGAERAYGQEYYEGTFILWLDPFWYCIGKSRSLTHLSYFSTS